MASERKDIPENRRKELQEEDCRDRVLVTGATGFLGQYLVRRLAGKYCVLALGRDAQKGKELEQLGAIFCPGDFTKGESCAGYFQGVRYVIHGGALSTVWGDWGDFYQTNVLATARIARWCQEKGVERLVYLSSPSIYTEKRDRYGIREEDAPEENNLNYYIRSKLMAEREVRRWESKGLETVILRPRGLIGIGDNSLVPRLLRANGSVGIPLFREGRNLVDLTSVENVALACELAMTAEGASGQVFNITNGEPTRFRELLEEFLEAAGEKPHYRKLPFGVMYGAASGLEWVYRLLHLPGEPALTRYTVCTLGFAQTMDISRARKVLGYQPEKRLRESIAEYGKWWREKAEEEGKQEEKGRRKAGRRKTLRGQGTKKEEVGKKRLKEERAEKKRFEEENVGKEKIHREKVRKHEEKNIRERKQENIGRTWGENGSGKIKKVTIYHCGYCVNNLAVMFRGRKWEQRRFPAAAVLICHRDLGNILYDTGYSERIFDKGILLQLYRWLNPVVLGRGQRIDEKLREDGISPESVKRIILSHAHPDHIGGLSRFEGYDLVALREVQRSMERPGIRSLVLTSQLPQPEKIRNWNVPEEPLGDHFLCRYFQEVYDLFGDGSVVGVRLEGHCQGQMGLWIGDQRLFLAADACWGGDLVQDTLRMRWIPRLIQEDFSKYRTTLRQICRMKKEYPEIQVIFSHQQGKEKVYV